MGTRYGVASRGAAIVLVWALTGCTPPAKIKLPNPIVAGNLPAPTISVSNLNVLGSVTPGGASGLLNQGATFVMAPTKSSKKQAEVQLSIAATDNNIGVQSIEVIMYGGGAYVGSPVNFFDGTQKQVPDANNEVSPTLTFLNFETPSGPYPLQLFAYKDEPQTVVITATNFAGLIATATLTYICPKCSKAPSPGPYVPSPQVPEPILCDSWSTSPICKNPNGKSMMLMKGAPPAAEPAAKQ